MRWTGRSRRGLAEIVGTLMLVVIVVAAATAFSFFVAAYQKQVQSQETLEHDKDLEDLRVLSLEPNTTGSSPVLNSLKVEIVSLDVNTIVVDGITLNGIAVQAYTITPAGTPISVPGCFNSNPLVTSNTSCVLTLPAEAQAFLGLYFNTTECSSAQPCAFANPSVINETGLLQFDIFTTLGNQFIQSFVPPVAIAHISFLVSNLTSYPVLDGSDSFQPNGGTTLNVTIDQWTWIVENETGGFVCPSDCGNYSGEEVELTSPFGTGFTYDIKLTVTNGESLTGSVTITYSVAP